MRLPRITIYKKADQRRKVIVAQLVIGIDAKLDMNCGGNNCVAVLFHSGRRSAGLKRKDLK